MSIKKFCHPINNLVSIHDVIARYHNLFWFMRFIVLVIWRLLRSSVMPWWRCDIRHTINQRHKDRNRHTNKKIETDTDKNTQKHRETVTQKHSRLTASGEINRQPDRHTQRSTLSQTVRHAIQYLRPFHTPWKYKALLHL